MNPVTIVICAYAEQRWVTLRRAVDVALKQISVNDELLVVVDHNDSLLAQCREALDDCVVIPNRHTRGLSGARNTALERARGSIIIFLDDDAVPLDGWFDGLQAPYTDKRVYGVGGFAKPRWSGGRPGWFPDEFLWVVGCSHLGLPTAMEPVRNLIGANMSFRKTAFDSAGGFEETMGRVGDRPFGCEETEFSIRLTQANSDAILMYNPSAQVEHHVSRQRGSVRYFVRRCWAEGLSKAEVSRRVGRSSALSAERDYASRVLPRGIWQGIRDSGTGDIWGAARAGAIVLGLAITTAGYCVENLRRPYSAAVRPNENLEKDGKERKSAPGFVRRAR
jgi:glycosyltransferase involved in cell wall biosynthesis